MKRILVIEDAPDVRAIIRDILEASGWEPLLAGDGEEGLRVAKSQVPDLILCDIRMPQRDGYSVLKELREHPPTANVPFVFLTGLGDKPNVRQAMELGADDYIVKPFTPQELNAAVESRFRKQASILQLADQKLNELRSTLNSALPHELVTPLNSILGFSALIMDAPEITVKQAREYAAHILEAGERLNQLIASFVFYSQLEVAAADPEKVESFETAEPIGTRERVSIIAERCAREVHRQGDLVLDLSESFARVAQIHLDRVVQELVRNAFKFSPPGKPVRITSRTENTKFELVVTDEGRGFSPEQLSRIGAHLQFDRETQEQQGTGLGLAIVRRLVELYRGNFWIESVPGASTSVHVQFRTELSV